MGEPVVIPIAELRHRGVVPTIPADAIPASGLVADRLGRPLRDLRISVTDRCNFRCGYCMPKDRFGADHAFLPQSSLLTFEEITRVAARFLAHGVTKLRLTGGEPLLRRHLPDLIAQLAGLRTVEGRAPDLTLTTNGVLLQRMARSLKDAGLNRVTVSLDALDDAVFQKMNDVGEPVATVLAGIDAALETGLAPLKVNMVVQRGVNDAQIEPMAAFFRDRPVQLRFIEFMDVGSTNGWQMDQVLPAADLLARLQRRWELEPVAASDPGETARRWRHVGARGEVGVIASVTQPFCRDCNRARLSTEGRLYTCLFATGGHDLRALLRGRGASDAELEAVIGSIWHGRNDRYSELRGEATGAAQRADGPRIEMSYIGG